MLPKIPRSDRNYIQILRQKSKGNEKGMSKTPKFSACGGLNSKNNSIIYSLSVKDGILITFEYKSPRSGDFFWGGRVFLKPKLKSKKNTGR